MKDLYNENFKTQKKEIEEDTGIWKDLPFHGIARINTVEVTILPWQSTDSIQSQPKFQGKCSQILENQY